MKKILLVVLAVYVAYSWQTSSFSGDPETTPSDTITATELLNEQLTQLDLND